MPCLRHQPMRTMPSKGREMSRLTSACCVSARDEWVKSKKETVAASSCGFFRSGGKSGPKLVWGRAFSGVLCSGQADQSESLIFVADSHVERILTVIAEGITSVIQYSLYGFLGSDILNIDNNPKFIRALKFNEPARSLHAPNSLVGTIPSSARKSSSHSFEFCHG